MPGRRTLLHPCRAFAGFAQAMQQDEPILGKPDTQRLEWKFEEAGIALEPEGVPRVHTFTGCAVHVRGMRRISLLWHPRGPERFLCAPPRRAPDGTYLHGVEVEIEVVHRGEDLARALADGKAWKVTLVTVKESIAFPHAQLRAHATGPDGFTRAEFRAEAEPETLGAD
jgi:hypothetical protein